MVKILEANQILEINAPNKAYTAMFLELSNAAVRTQANNELKYFLTSVNSCANVWIIVDRVFDVIQRRSDFTVAKKASPKTLWKTNTS